MRLEEMRSESNSPSRDHPGGLRPDVQAAGHDRVGVTGVPWGRARIQQRGVGRCGPAVLECKRLIAGAIAGAVQNLSLSISDIKLFLRHRFGNRAGQVRPRLISVTSAQTSFLKGRQRFAREQVNRSDRPTDNPHGAKREAALASVFQQVADRIGDDFAWLQCRPGFRLPRLSPVSPSGARAILGSAAPRRLSWPDDESWVFALCPSCLRSRVNADGTGQSRALFELSLRPGSARPSTCAQTFPVCRRPAAAGRFDTTYRFLLTSTSRAPSARYSQMDRTTVLSGERNRGAPSAG